MSTHVALEKGVPGTDAEHWNGFGGKGGGGRSIGDGCNHALAATTSSQRSGVPSLPVAQSFVVVFTYGKHNLSLILHSLQSNSELSS
jgi:hypothetical protein